MSDHKTILASIHLFVKDMSASVSFYRHLGLSIPGNSIWSVEGKGHHAEIPMPNGFVLELDSIELTKGYDKQWQDPVGPSRNLIMFSLPSRPEVDTLHDALMAMGYCAVTLFPWMRSGGHDTLSFTTPMAIWSVS